MIGRRARAEWEAVTSHVDALLREYRSKSVESLRALPDYETLPGFRVGDHEWLIYTQVARLKDGSVSFAIIASRECWFARLAGGNGFVMDASGQSRDLTIEERRDLT